MESKKGDIALKIAKIYDNAILPNRKHYNDAGLDLYACLQTHNKALTLRPGELDVVETGVMIEIPDGFVGLIWPKSRSDFLIGGGVIDSSYQGQILVKVMNVTNYNVTIYNGDAVAQLLIQPVLIPEVVEVDISEIHRKKSERGNSGGVVSQFNDIYIRE